MKKRVALGVVIAFAGFSTASAAQPDQPWRIDAGASRSNLSGPQSAWNDANIAFTYRPDLETWWTARLEHSDRFAVQPAL